MDKVETFTEQFGSFEQDQELMKSWLAENLVTDTVAGFYPGPGIQKLKIRFDIIKLREAFEEARKHFLDIGDGFMAIPLTRRPSVSPTTETDLIGRYYLRPDETYKEIVRDELVDEFAFSELCPEFERTYFETLHQQLSSRFPIGRMRALLLNTYKNNSWHRDPEPRLHIPIITNPGSLFVVNHHVTHLPADGSVYFTDTRGYHTAINGGEQSRVHIVATLPLKT